MGTKIKISVLIGLMIVSLAPNAIADKVCLKTTVDKRTFKVTNKSVVAATCPKGFTELADTSSFQGPAGPPFDTTTCYSKATSEDSYFGIAVTELSCNNTSTDFMLADGLDKTRLSPIISEKKLILDSTSKVPVGVEYTTGYLSGTTTYTQTVTIVCCKRDIK